MTQHLHGPARQQLLADVRNLYALGMTIRQIAAQTGYSYTATHRQLLAAGVTLRPKHGDERVQLREGGPFDVPCPRCHVPVGKPCVSPQGVRKPTHRARLRKPVTR
jgi:hypothetical protein